MKQSSRFLQVVALSGLASIGGILGSSGLSITNEVNHANFFETANAAKANLQYKRIGRYKAPNGKIYTILQKTDKIFSFKNSAGVTSGKIFSSKDEVTSYIAIRNPLPLVESAIVPSTSDTTTTQPAPVLVTPAPDTTTTQQPAPVVVTQPPTPTPAPVVTPTPAPSSDSSYQPKPDTVSRAS